MRVSILSTLVLSALSPLAAAVCSTTPGLNGTDLELAQQAALKDFADLFLVKKDIQKAFDEYIPGEYINHNPAATDGRQAALNILKPFMSQVQYRMATATAGQGYGYLHYQMTMGGSRTAVMDKYRFVGTCIVEHWDVAQGITGRESNPKAFW